MEKKDFNKIVSDNITEVDRKSQTQQAIEAFQEFQNKSIPKEVAAYTWEDKEVLIEIFSFEPEDELSLDLDTSASILNKVRYFSVARVLASGPESKYKVGQLVKLKDRDTLTIENSAYKEWVNNPMSNSNMKQKGQEPPRFMSNIFQTFSQYTFILNPFDIKSLDEGKDEGVYKIYDNKIENPIENVEILFDID